jgi:hypothetical protein
MRGMIWVILLVALAAAACRKSPAVTVEQVYEGERPDPQVKARVFAPRCGELPPALYPTDLPAGQRPERVDVRVDLVIDERGRARNLKTTVTGEVADPEPFVEAAIRAAYMLRCEPAMRTPRPDSDEQAPVPIEYRSAVVFRFFRDETRVDVLPQGR